MISCDTNILFPAFAIKHVNHVAARQFLHQHLANRRFALCELILVEFYTLLCNPVVAGTPLSPAGAVSLISGLRKNPAWALLDYPGGLMAEVWQMAGNANFARRRIYDVRLALTLRYHGITEFATANVRDFDGFGFTRVWNPLESE